MKFFGKAIPPALQLVGKKKASAVAVPGQMKQHSVAAVEKIVVWFMEKKQLSVIASALSQQLYRRS